jgi:streptomycin 6-kinase
LLQKTRKRLYSGLYQNKSAIIKIVTDIEGLRQEVDALLYFKIIAPKNIPTVFLYDNNVLIMEQIFPGTTLKQMYTLDDVRSMDLFCKSLQLLHQPYVYQSQEQFQTLHQLIVQLRENSWGISREYVETAYKTAQWLLKTTDQSVLLHGDLYHDNILYSDTSGWVVIDLKGVVGDPVYDIVTALSSPLSELLQHKNPKNIIEERIVFVAQQLSYSEDRIRKWLYVKSVLSWLWALEDNEPEEWVNYFATIAYMFKNNAVVD